MGCARKMFLTAVYNTTITLSAIAGGVVSGDVFVLACLVSGAYFLNPAVTFCLLVARSFHMPFSGFVREMAPQLAVAAAMFAVAFALRMSLCVFFAAAQADVY